MTVYVCTRCQRLFNARDDVKGHLRAEHPDNGNGHRVPVRKKGPKKVDLIFAAIESGAKSAKDVQKKTGLPTNTVHSYLTYLRHRKRIKGDSQNLKVVSR